MEEYSNLTAERSLEIITQQIERSRKAVSKEAGLSLYIAGLSIMGMAIFIGICTFFTHNQFFYLLYVLLPVIIIGIDRYVKKNKPKVPDSLVGTMVGKTWRTFGIFALFLCVFAILYNFVMARLVTPEEYLRLGIVPFRYILLLMGMTITVTGYILKSRWLVWCGIIGGIGGFIWETFGVTNMFLSRLCDISSYYRYTSIPPTIIIVIFAFVGLTLPGWMLKKTA